MAHDRKIVGDEQIGEAEALAQILEQVDHLRLDRHVERGDGLVAHYELGFERQGARDPDALALPARHLVRITVGEFRIEAADREQLAHPGSAPCGVAFDAVDHDRLGNDLADLHARVERAVRILENDLDAAPQCQKVLALRLGDIDAVKKDRACGRPFEPQDAPAGRRLAAAALADQPQGLAAPDSEIDAVDGFHLADLAVDNDPLGDREMHLQPPDLEERMSVDRGHTHLRLPVEPNGRQILIDIKARADLPPLNIGPVGHNPMLPQHE